MKIPFTKMHGTGNDFILINNFDNHYSLWEPAFVKQLCAFHTGIGADGLLVLEKDDQYDFRMRFYNSDGYESDMCVNGSRCICWFAYTLGYVKKDLCFIANDGTHKATILDDEVEVQVNYKEDAGDIKFPDEYILPKDVVFKAFLNTGVPHVILEVEDIEQLNVYGIGKEIRYHNYYQPSGTNVNFVKRSKNQSILRIRTYERGVESETLSCGSGATAAAITYARQLNQKQGTIEVITAGGALQIRHAENFNTIYLRGPVREVFKGTYSLEG